MESDNRCSGYGRHRNRWDELPPNQSYLSLEGGVASLVADQDVLSLECALGREESRQTDPYKG